MPVITKKTAYSETQGNRFYGDGYSFDLPSQWTTPSESDPQSETTSQNGLPWTSELEATLTVKVKLISRKTPLHPFVWPESPEDALRYLEDPTTPTIWRENAILSINDFEIDDNVRPRVLESLAKYISQNRTTQDEDRIVVVGSAIRDFAMLMDEDRFDHYGKWFFTSGRETLSMLVQLELLKGICWRIQFVPLKRFGSFSLLRLFAEMTVVPLLKSDTLRSGVLGATALNGVTAVFLLNAVADNHETTGLLWEKVKESRKKWFVEMVHDHIREAQGYIAQHDTELSIRVGKMLAEFLVLEDMPKCQHGR